MKALSDNLSPLPQLLLYLALYPIDKLDNVLPTPTAHSPMDQIQTQEVSMTDQSRELPCQTQLLARTLRLLFLQQTLHLYHSIVYSPLQEGFKDPATAIQIRIPHISAANSTVLFVNVTVYMPPVTVSSVILSNSLCMLDCKFVYA